MAPACSHCPPMHARTSNGSSTCCGWQADRQRAALRAAAQAVLEGRLGAALEAGAQGVLGGRLLRAHMGKETPGSLGLRTTCEVAFSVAALSLRRLPVPSQSAFADQLARLPWPIAWRRRRRSSWSPRRSVADFCCAHFRAQSRFQAQQAVKKRAQASVKRTFAGCNRAMQSPAFAGEACLLPRLPAGADAEQDAARRGKVEGEGGPVLQLRGRKLGKLLCEI